MTDIQKCAYKPDCECDGYHCVGCADDLCEHVCAELTLLAERVEELERIESSLTMLANQKDGRIKELEAVAKKTRAWVNARARGDYIPLAEFREVLAALKEAGC